MPLHIETGEHKTLVKISGEMTIYTAAELKQALTPLLYRQQALELDLSGVSEMDSAGLQLLLAAKKTMQQGDSPLHLVMHSHAVLDALELCQLAAFFGDPTLIPHADHA
ncbi:anti-sigma B factor antagonist [Aeromonas salmonicida subsp. salmonicida]|uniref:Anti-sigma factor antagonist n=2 Tax=Aeromonas salmonicida subsp. salmonicida TaxID=29491 RepID=A4SQT2_AERS4|nr:STAS domain-containing protein [Aeromonas salmonicida]ABO91254.1 sulfate transporter/antisigma-factor antagonist STAS [Aeromonas salmonicida subsp. salmonicida A449]ASI24180.1 anti-sigma factor antagonist [Aeromonas salmonicida]ASI28499.1 anti-sigma factor antagonist [Aeromonas salmonicida]ASI32629.1 anti-sigma factor antagonist [Aeromonas salmonicida]ATD39947.1 anti-sigma B factor antagonist [Aeromonas salmonicida subsp. masoucida]